MIIIITHTDPDGWASEWVVRRFLDLNCGNKSPIARFNYNYSGDTSEIEKFIEANRSEVSDIYMTDITLPDNFMETYADLITHIDHHKSALEGSQGWRSKLRCELSAVSTPGYLGNSGEEAEQISACELCWLKLFPGMKMPMAIRLLGRYDVWDHDSNGLSVILHTYVSTVLSTYGMDIPLSQEFDKIMTDDSSLQAALFEGSELIRYRKILDAADCRSKAYVVRVFDTPVVISNRRVSGSQFFQDTIENHPEVELMICWVFNHRSRLWGVSCYSVEGKSTSALEFLRRVGEHIPGVLSLGGHDRACGMTLRKEDIGLFLDLVGGAE